MSLNAQTVTVAPTSLSFTAQVGTTPATQQSLTVSSTTASTFFTATAAVSGTSVQWLKLSNSTNPTPQTALTGSTGTASAVITVTADPTNLTGGTYNATISINNVQVPVTFSVASIGVSPQTVALGTYQAGSATYPPAVTVSVTGATNGFTISKAPADTWYTAAIFGTSAVIVQFNQAAAASLTVGTYTGTLTITPTGSGTNVPVNVPVTLTVTPSPAVTLTSCPKATGCALAFNWQLGGTNNQSSQTLNFTTTATVPLNFGVTVSAANSGNWITAPNNGTIVTAGTPVTISVNGANLAPGTYNGSVTFTVPGGLFANGSNALTIPVTLTVSNFSLLYVDKPALAFSYQFGSGTASLPVPQNVTPASTGAPNTQLQFTLTSDQPWLTVPVGAPTTPTPFAVSVNPANLAPGSYTGNVTVTPAPPNPSGQAAFKIPVTLTVTSTPTIIVSSNALVFPYQLGQSVPAPQIVNVLSSSGAPLNYTVTAPSTATWLQLGGATTGTTDQTSFTVAVNTTGAVAGTQDATVTVTATDPATGAAVNTQSIDVKLVVSANPLLVVSPSSPIVLSITQNGASSQTLNLSSTNPAVPLTIGSSNIVANGSWLSLTPAPASTPGSISVSAATAGLTPGTYSGSIAITATGAGSTAVADSYTIPVTLNLAAAVATPSVTSLNFTAQTGGAPAASQPISISTGGTPLPFSAVANDGGINWLSVTNASGTTPGTVTVSVDASKLTTGTYQGAVYLNVPGAVWPNGAANPIRIPVTFTVTAGTISTTATTLTFTQVAGGAAPAAQSIALTGTPNAISYSVATSMTNGSGWLTAVSGAGTATSGTTPTPVTVSVNAGTGTSALPVGTYNGSVTITAPGATGSPISVPVVFNVVTPQALTLSSTSAMNFSYTIGVTATPLTQTVGLTSAGSAQFTATATSTGNWLSVTPASGTATSTSTTLTVSVNPANLTAGSYTGTVSIASPTSLAPLTIPVNLTVLAVAPPVLQAIKNSASYATGAVAPGELVIIVGTNLGPTPLAFGAVTAGKLATTVSGTQVLFDGIAAPIYYASAGQTAVFVPYEIAGRPTTSVTVVSPGATSTATVYNVISAQPGIFTQNSQGFGPGSILNPDNTVNGPNSPVAQGSYIQVFMTGEGQTSPAGVTGAMIPSDGSGLKMPVGQVTATIGGVPLPPSSIIYAGSAPGDPSGVFQVDLYVPTGLTPGPQSIIVSVAGNSSQSGVTVQVK